MATKTTTDTNEPQALMALALEEACGACEGSGSFYMEGPCESCCGSGYVPTEAGEKLLALVRHNMPRLIRGR